MSISSSLVQQLARPVSAAVVDFVPLVQGGCCRSEHDEELLLKAQAAHPRGWVVAACPCQYLPGDGVMELRELRELLEIQELLE